jgi:DNA-binding PadR family transcriptional regulator
VDRRPSAQTIALLQALAAEPDTWRHGYDLGQEIGLKAGSLYPILMRLHDRGLLDSSWEQQPDGGRPPRHLYRLTAAGLDYAAAHHTPEPARRRTALNPRLASGDLR